MSRSAHERAAILPRLADVFREHGFEGASLSLISEKTGLGKGSLYHFFPGGKQEMAAEVLEHIAHWFEHNLFETLSASGDPRAAIVSMFRTIDDYFRSGRRTCLVGTFALANMRDRFAATIYAYFAAWRNTLADALQRAGKEQARADELAEDVIIGIQAALVTARAFDDPALFGRVLQRLERHLDLN